MVYQFDGRKWKWCAEQCKDLDREWDYHDDLPIYCTKVDFIENNYPNFYCATEKGQKLYEPCKIKLE